MKSAWIALVAALIGVGLGWVLSAALHGDGPTPSEEPPATVGPPASAGEAPTEPRLVGLPPPVTPSSVAISTPVAPSPAASGPTEEDVEVIEFAGLDDEDPFLDADAWIPDGPDGHRGWNALLTLYALAGRDADFRRAAARALEAGVEPGTVLQVLLLLPPDKHVAVLDHLLQGWPDLAWDVAQVADIYTGAGAGERAVELLVPALESGATAELAERLVRADPDRAARLLGALSGGESWTGDLLRQVGWAFVHASRPDLGLPFLQEALALQPLDHDALTALAQVDRSLALEHARTLTQQHPERGDVWTWLAQMEQAAGHPQAAFDAWRAAADVELTTEVLYGMMGADPERAYQAATELASNASDDEVLGAVAKVALKGGHVEDTMETLLRAHERDPSDHEWMTALVALDPKRAAEVIGRSASSFSGEGRDEVVGAHGNALLELGHPDAAFDRYREAFELDPADWEWQRGLARSDPQRAIPLLEARREEAGDEADLIGALGDAYAGAGRRAEALALYEQAAASGGGDEWYARMGLVDPERALADLDRRTREAPGVAEAWGALGDLQRDLGHRAEALNAYARARELAPASLIYEIRYRQMGD